MRAGETCGTAGGSSAFPPACAVASGGDLGAAGAGSQRRRSGWGCCSSCAYPDSCTSARRGSGGACSALVARNAGIECRPRVVARARDPVEIGARGVAARSDCGAVPLLAAHTSSVVHIGLCRTGRLDARWRCQPLARAAGSVAAYATDACSVGATAADEICFSKLGAHERVHSDACPGSGCGCGARY